MQDLNNLWEKMSTARNQVETLRPDYKYKKQYYIEAKEKLEELRE